MIVRADYPLVVMIDQEEDLEKAFSDSAREASLEARRARMTGAGYTPKIGKDGRADVNRMLEAVDNRRTKTGHLGHRPGSPFNAEKVTSDERAILELNREKVNPLEIAKTLGLPFTEVRDKMRGWRLLPIPVYN